MATYPRISARRGNDVDLNVTFYRGGVATDPYAIIGVDIYRTQVLDQNLVASFAFPRPCEAGYPAPATKVTADIPAGDCGTEPQIGAPQDGQYTLLWSIPSDLVVPDVYLDVWSFIPTNPCDMAEFAAQCDTDNCYPDLTDAALEDLVLTICNRFWVYPDDWGANDGLETIQLGFEPLTQKFRQPESRPLEVGITPLPMYDYNFNLVAPVIPFIQGTITIKTLNNEILVDEGTMEMGLRQGAYRTNPFVLRYSIDTMCFLIGTYKYRVTATLPDGTSRTSGDFILTIS